MGPSDERALEKKIDEFRAEFRVLVTKLMGDDEAENVEGRIPRLEAARRNHNKRILRLEGLALMGFGGLALAKAIGWALDAGAHFVQVARLFK
jgi:hypothetical protein